MINELITRIQDLNKFDGRGTNSKCYCIDEYALLYGRIELETIDQRKQVSKSI